MLFIFSAVQFEADTEAGTIDNSSEKISIIQTQKCILHVDDKPFTGKLFSLDNKWEQIIHAANVRQSKKQFNSSKYRHVIESLPPVFDRSHVCHYKCYSDFTAVTGPKPDKPQKMLRSSSTSSINTSSGLLNRVCLFCNKSTKWKNNVREDLSNVVTNNAAQTILTDATDLNDSVVLAKVSAIDMCAKEACYHRSCLKVYHSKAQRCLSDKVTVDEKKLDGMACQAICSYVATSVIGNNRIESLVSIYKRYELICEESQEIPFGTAYYLKSKLENHFGTRLQFSSSSKKSGMIVYNSDLASTTLNEVFNFEDSEEGIVQKAAMILRKKLKSVESPKLPDQFTMDDLIRNQVSAPALVTDFFKTLYSGPNKPVQESIVRKAKSSSDDALFNVSAGCVKPLKHIAMGVTLKSLTGSKRIITLMNRLGHSINYTNVTEIETEDALSLLEKETISPTDAIQQSPMGLAFDNYDEFTYTLSGSGSLHDTNGIMYQNKAQNSCSYTRKRPRSESPMTPCTSNKRPRRKLVIPDVDLDEYNKIPKMNKFDYENRDVWNVLDVSDDAVRKDFLWLNCHSILKRNIPMWVGFNVQFQEDCLPQQEIMYMPNLNKPITSLSAVQETLRITQRCARECEQQYGIVTYDLAVAKPAVQIQTTDQPKFDDIFIMYGPFHIQMCLFKAIGKLISDSGGLEILNECGILATGSMNGVISGKHFNRCKRLHPILSLALEYHHFHKFLASYEHANKFKELISVSVTDPTKIDLDYITKNPVFESTLKAYQTFQNDTKSGKLGPTAQFWFMYIQFINHFHHFDRAIRTNNIDLFIWSLSTIIDLFFATNHVNYARWMSKYQLDLMHIEQTHPGLRKILDEGAFTTRRTDKPFSRSAVDITLEQTVNRDCASQLTGISSMTDNYCARLRFMVTKSNRSRMTGVLMDMAGLQTIHDATNELKSSRVIRDNSDLNKVISHIQSSCNVFENNGGTNDLFNIFSGKCTSEEVKNCLLNIPETGKNLHRDFIEECERDPDRFEKPIHRNKLLTFSNECAKNKRSQNPKISALKCTSSLMGRLVVLATNKEIDLQHILTYPLTPVPLTMCNADGVMAKTDKSTLFRKLEEFSKSKPPNAADACIVDGNFILYTLPLSNLPKTYEGLARTYLIKICALSTNSVHVAFDSYHEPSIKSSERSRRGNSVRNYVITGPQQNRPVDMLDALKSTTFKKSLPSFFVEEWKKDHYMDIIGTRILYVNHLGICTRYFVQNGEFKNENVLELCCNHDEADTKLCLHALYSSKMEGITNIVIRASDTDVGIILIHHAHKCRANMWMLTGLISKNNLRYVNLTEIANSLGSDVCDALPAIHAFTGSDYTSCFVQKGKVNPFKRISECQEYTKAFAEITLSDTAPADVTNIEKVVCQMYNSKTKYNDVNKLRYETFLRFFGPSTTAKKPLDKIKNLDPKSLPPCRAELSTHIARTSYVARMWSKANTCVLNPPTESDGWYLSTDNQYEVIWFNGPQLPDKLVPELPAEEDEDDNNEDYECIVQSSDDEDYVE